MFMAANFVATFVDTPDNADARALEISAFACFPRPPMAKLAGLPVQPDTVWASAPLDPDAKSRINEIRGVYIVIFKYIFIYI